MTMWWHPDKFSARYDNLQTRNRIIKSIRKWFENHDITEVQTPALQIMGSADTHIHTFETTIRDRALKPAAQYTLHTSPEIAMKKLLVAGAGDIFQICPVFRNGEQGAIHRPEFTMLEWYRINTDYTAMMRDCEEMVKSLGIKTYTHKSITCDVTKPWQKLSVEAAFDQYANINLAACADTIALKAAAQQHNIRTAASDTWDDIFHAIMVDKIEPKLGHDRPTILYDYPISMAALAKKSQNPQYAERFELYICGIELANAYTELTESAEQETRLKQDLAQKKAIYNIDAPIDDDFIKALQYGMPESSGCALGLDRLIMLACGVGTISDISWTGI